MTNDSQFNCKLLKHLHILLKRDVENPNKDM